MFFNSYIFIFAFLPLTLLGYFGLQKFRKHTTAKVFLCIMSLVFYAYYNIAYLWIIISSIILNYFGRKILVKQEGIKRKVVFIILLLANIGILVYFKYFDFMILAINNLFKTSFDALNILLPLGISFFTFQQLAFIIDSYKNKENMDYSFLDYSLFVTFFPKVIQGPIALHVEYIFNKDILYDFTITNIGFFIKKINKNNDLAYNWNLNYDFSKEAVLANYSRPEISEIQVDSNYYMQNYEANMHNITKYIEKYPETKFIIFFHPYSILLWDKAIRQNQIEAQIAVTEHVIEDLLQYNNVELYYFTNIEEIITNLDNYKDYTHYKEDINYYMYECMCKTGNHRITKENYMSEINKMRNLAISYDYDKIFEE